MPENKSKWLGNIKADCGNRRGLLASPQFYGLTGWGASGQGGSIVDTTAQNIAIAEFCGWSQIENKNTMAPGGIWFGYPPKKPIIGRKERLPEYTSDLNAMHEAEKMLTFEQCHDYHDMLMKFGFKRQYEPPIDGWCLHATAAQRAKALLRTIGKWSD